MSKRILFIDDEPEFVRPQVTMLEEEDYEVVLEPDPVTALDLLRQNAFDLIILDLIIPPSQPLEGNEEEDWELAFSNTGMDLHREIRERMGVRDIPIIFLSVVRDQELRNQLKQREGRCGQRFRFLAKPVSSSDVLAAVHSAIGSSQSS